VENYGRRLVIDQPFLTALDAIKQALAAEGLDIVGRIDLRDLLARSTGRETRRYIVLHAAAPEALLEAIREDLGSPTTLPAAVAIFELADGETAVIVTEPFAAFLADPGWRAEAPHLAALADRECERLARALDRLRHAITTAGGRIQAASCRWATPTLFVSAPVCYDAEESLWSCTRDAGTRPLETTEVCADCERWEPRAPQER
jgi:uncharacterized protein (DUF302 family)